MFRIMTCHVAGVAPGPHLQPDTVDDHTHPIQTHVYDQESTFAQSPLPSPMPEREYDGPGCSSAVLMRAADVSVSSASLSYEAEYGELRNEPV